ncbi:MAG: large conductance mechanosensitive channel protein MscL [Rhodothermales bacterium]|nr:large conductance mechanosensitive channel protein MscL [Rhodothermales bacterium]
MWKEFKEFAVKGNVMDLAIGVIIGAAFSKIVDSFVNDLVMPVVSLVTGGVDFTNKFAVLKPSADGLDSFATLEAAKTAGAVTLNYGQFITILINFLIVAFALFILVKGINKMRRQEAAAPDAPAAPTKEEELLIEIRDLLAAKS